MKYSVIGVTASTDVDACDPEHAIELAESERYVCDQCSRDIVDWIVFDEGGNEVLDTSRDEAQGALRVTDVVTMLENERDALREALTEAERKRDEARAEIERLRGIVIGARHYIGEDMLSTAYAMLCGNGLDDGIADDLKDADVLRRERDEALAYVQQLREVER